MISIVWTEKKRPRNFWPEFEKKFSNASIFHADYWLLRDFWPEEIAIKCFLNLNTHNKPLTKYIHLYLYLCRHFFFSSDSFISHFFSQMVISSPIVDILPDRLGLKMKTVKSITKRHPSLWRLEMLPKEIMRIMLWDLLLASKGGKFQKLVCTRKWKHLTLRKKR